MRFGSLELKNNLFLAPLAGITDTIFRQFAKRYGCGLVFSEMINSNGVLRGGIPLLEKLCIDPSEGEVGIQIAGDDPDIMAEAAKTAVDAGAATININMGCPVQKVTRNQAGCALMKNPKRVQKIIASVKQAITVPLSIKIRLGWDHQNINFLEIAKIAEEEGCAAIMMHARTRTDGFSGHAQWEHIKTLKEKRSILVIGNGDVTSPQKALSLLKQTGCDGVMIGRGALGQPWLFQQILEAQRGSPVTAPPLGEIKNIILEHLDLSLKRHGKILGLRLMQKHFAWYSKGLPKSAAFRHAIHQLKNVEETLAFMERYFNEISGPAEQRPADKSDPRKNPSYIAHQ